MQGDTVESYFADAYVKLPVFVQQKQSRTIPTKRTGKSQHSTNSGVQSSRCHPLAADQFKCIVSRSQRSKFPPKSDAEQRGNSHLSQHATNIKTIGFPSLEHSGMLNDREGSTHGEKQTKMTHHKVSTQFKEPNRSSDRQAVIDTESVDKHTHVWATRRRVGAESEIFR